MRGWRSLSRSHREALLFTGHFTPHWTLRAETRDDHTSLTPFTTGRETADLRIRNIFLYLMLLTELGVC